MKKPIRILSAAMDILGEIDNYESMFFIHRCHGIGEIELRINRYKKHVDKLLKGNLILVGSQLNKVFQLKHREIELDENGKITENWLIKGFALKVVVAQRITIPPNHTAYDNKQGNAETVMKHYVDRNIINLADPKRKIPELILAINQNRGTSISWQSRYKNLAEEMTEISLAAGLGWDVYLDIQQKKWVFDVFEGRNLTVNQSINPPVIFSPQFESLKSLHYTESELNYKNIAYVAGQGEGVDRRVIELGNQSGLSRHELFIDARDIEEETDVETIDTEGNKVTEKVPRPEADIIKDLTDRGRRQLQEFLQEEYLEGQILTDSPFVYEKDYNLGDIVTVQSKDWGVTLDTRITEIKEIYEQSGFKIEAVFGNDRPTLIQKIKQELSQISGEVRR
ncbi:siphovirus ReqiPepy6 Gp37-like family protein [Metabacillus fastidiosus]|uniref:siphovirus ReqiPepy6 Gp37-like family protein n=1 Tax=Metabacillus fastidiosus TaxID=1458 RepID=UPI0008249B51|nr:siphovirus ReqiPepy6 Gp37-like family protein [Metabacillus fastidiosus]MED4461870.1 siphovirus ReqiPepy6 Gp37-like family protein [Metabacillus fastidiosus]